MCSLLFLFVIFYTFVFLVFLLSILFYMDILGFKIYLRAPSFSCMLLCTKQKPICFFFRLYHLPGEKWRHNFNCPISYFFKRVNFLLFKAFFTSLGSQIIQNRFYTKKKKTVTFQLFVIYHEILLRTEKLIDRNSCSDYGWKLLLHFRLRPETLRCPFDC